jgi:hypothetical protein
MAKARKVLSNPGLIAYSKEHVLYEISMLVECGHLLARSFQSESVDLARVLRNVVVESFAIHLRNLVDFLYPGKYVHNTDVLADHFFPHEKRPAAFPSLPPELQTARQRAHKQVSHLTTGRLKEGDPGKGWATSSLVSETLSVLVEFVEQASPHKLDCSVRDYVLAVSRSTSPWGSDLKSSAKSDVD